MARPRPYRKRNIRRRVPNRKGRSFGSVASGILSRNPYGSVALKAYKMARRLMDSTNIEYKELQTLSSSQTPPYSGTIYTLNTVAQGDDFNQRIGDSIKCQNLTLRGKILPPPSSNAAEFIRLTIFWDKQNVITTGGQLWNNAGGTLAPFSQKTEDTKYQSKVLYDRTWKLIPNTDNDAQQFTVVLPINMHTHYSGNTTTIKDGALKMCLISDQTTAVHLVSFDSIVSYTDN